MRFVFVVIYSYYFDRVNSNIRRRHAADECAALRRSTQRVYYVIIIIIENGARSRRTYALLNRYIPNTMYRTPRPTGPRGWYRYDAARVLCRMFHSSLRRDYTIGIYRIPCVMRTRYTSLFKPEYRLAAQLLDRKQEPNIIRFVCVSARSRDRGDVCAGGRLTFSYVTTNQIINRVSCVSHGRNQITAPGCLHLIN